MTGGRILLLVLAGLGVVWWIGSTSPADQTQTNANWHVIGGLSDGLKTKFVEMSPQHARNRREYDNAVNTLCRDISICTVAFFFPGDRVPADQSAKVFFDRGGWTNYPVVALWWGNRNSGSFEYTKWDCDRAGVEGAPANALCGPGVNDAYSAVLSLAGRAGTAEACGWPKNDDAKLTLAYINNIKEPTRQQEFRKGFERLYQTSKKVPDDRADCSRLRSKIEASAKAARKTLGF